MSEKVKLELIEDSNREDDEITEEHSNECNNHTDNDEDVKVCTKGGFGSTSKISPTTETNITGSSLPTIKFHSPVKGGRKVLGNVVSVVILLVSTVYTVNSIIYYSDPPPPISKGLANALKEIICFILAVLLVISRFYPQTWRENVVCRRVVPQNRETISLLVGVVSAIVHFYTLIRWYVQEGRVYVWESDNGLTYQLRWDIKLIMSSVLANFILSFIEFSLMLLTKMRPKYKDLNPHLTAFMEKQKLSGTMSETSSVEEAITHEENKFSFSDPTSSRNPAFLEYSVSDNVLDMLHTFVPPAMRGRGVAGALVRVGLKHAASRNLRVSNFPKCRMLSFTSFIISLLVTVLSADKLKLSILMFRHGDRSAIGMIPSDIYNVSSWPMGPGELTPIGMENHLRNGKFFSDRYTDPEQDTYLGLDEHYRYGQVYVRSTDRDRTLMSAESMLAGLFPPKENKLDSPLDVWQPIPVHTVPMSSEPMLDGSPSACEYWAVNTPKTIKQNKEFIGFMENQTEIIKDILNVTGIKYQSDQWQLFRSIANTYDTLFCEKCHNMTFKPEFVEKNLFDLVKPYSDMDWRTYGMMTTKEKALSGGVLLKELKSRVAAAVDGSSDVKLVLFSGHDTTLAAILTCLGVYDLKQTPYATVLMLELWEKEDGDHVIRFLRHHTGQDLIEYTLPGCSEGEGCTLEQFYKVNSEFDLTEEEYRDACKVGFPDILPGLSKNTLFLLLCISILVCLSSVSMLTFYTYRVKQRAGIYPTGMKYKIFN
ncbi:hypothetical protein ACHWQZ_G009084 [Mnemiopsis leidyi]